MNFHHLLINNFFNDVNKQKLHYVIWKNTNLIELFFLGKENLDLYININDYNKLKKILKNHKWIKLSNTSRNYKNIDHYFLFTYERIYHLHIYSKLITGDSILKQFDFTQLFDLKKKFFSTKYNIWILDYAIQYNIFRLRFVIKNSTLFGRYLYKKEINSYVDEFLFIRNKINFDDFIILNFNRNYLFNYEINNSLSNFDNSIFKKIIINIRNYENKNFYESYALLVKYLYFYSINKIFSKKNFKLRKGIAVFISGCDASGKTTVINNLENIFNKKIEVSSFSIAKPYPNIVITLAKNNKIKNLKKNTSKNISKIDKSESILFNFKNIILSFLRYLTFRKIKRNINKNKLILCDRYISHNIGDINGPRLKPNCKNIFFNFLYYIENYFYNKIKPLEYEIRLLTSINTAINRNNNRKKSLYKSDEEIVERFNTFEKSVFLSNNCIIYENNSDLNSSMVNILNILNTILTSNINDYS